MLEPTGTICICLWLFFVAFSHIALMNILTGIFVENAMKLAEPDRQAIYLEMQRERVKQEKELRDIISKMDVNEDGTISHYELDNELSHPKSRLRTYLGTLGLEEVDVARFYRMLQSVDIDRDQGKDQEVEVAHFVSACIRLRADPHSLDMQAMKNELRIIHQKVPKLHEEFKK